MPKDTSKKEKNTKNKRHFFKDFKAELKKVIWPTPKQLVNSTVAVITIVLVTAIIVFVLDLTFEAINTYGINKLKSAMDSNNEIANSVENNTVADSNTEAEVNNTENVTTQE